MVVDMELNSSDVAKVVEASQVLPAAEGVYLETDFITNLMATVIDFNFQTTAVERAISHYKTERWDEIRTLDDLEAVMARYPDDKAGNTDLAIYLWGYKRWDRAEILRNLATFFRGEGVVDQPSLRAWAHRAEFSRDFEGRVRGLGPAVFQWLVMRQGVETVKPDVHVLRFVLTTLGRSVSDWEAVQLVEAAALELDLKAYELDWRIWEAARN